ncbi:MAG: hypothetical protein GVY13_16730 [Alphaproteobacteria bacterium]|jgi:hypothetical protein|nr:hypothetical protein [Alphaproteobacteria bacterium]
MSPFDSFPGALEAPAGLSDHDGPIMVGFPNEAIIADWPRYGAGDRGGESGQDSPVPDDFANEAPLIVCSAADENW